MAHMVEHVFATGNGAFRPYLGPNTQPAHK